MANWILSGLVILGVEVALGRSTFTAWVSSGAVMMKITSSTSITSISGTMLISAIGAPAFFESKLAHAMALGFPRGGAAHADRDQRVVDPPDGAEQPDERRGGADGGQHREAVLEPRGFFVEH